jgi:hypothetical protein
VENSCQNLQPDEVRQITINHLDKYPTDLKSTMNPYASKIMPITGHPMTTKKKPAPNEMVPCITSKAQVWRENEIHAADAKFTCAHRHRDKPP